MIDILAAASIHSAMRQDFPDHLEHRLVREQSRRKLALHEAYSLFLLRWQSRPRRDQLPFSMVYPPL